MSKQFNIEDFSVFEIKHNLFIRKCRFYFTWHIFINNKNLHYKVI